MKTVKEFSVITPNDEQHFDKKSDAKLYWENLSKDEKENSQYFSKEWIYSDGEYKEGEVIILK